MLCRAIGFQPIAVGVDDIGGEIVRAVVGAQARLAILPAAGRKCRRVEIRNASKSEPPLKFYGGRLRNELERFVMRDSELHGVGEANPRRAILANASQLIDEAGDSDFRGADASAYELVLQFYDIFGFEEADVPYVDRSGDRPRISVESFAD